LKVIIGRQKIALYKVMLTLIDAKVAIEEFAYTGKYT